MSLQLVKLVDPINVFNADMTFKGPFDEATDYTIGDVVSYEGSSYVLYAEAVAGVLPIDESKWTIFAEKGTDGTGGVTGAEFFTDEFEIKDRDDETKKIEFDLSASSPDSVTTIVSSASGSPVITLPTDSSTLATTDQLLDKMQNVTPGTDGNVLTSNGTDWVSEAPSGGGGSADKIEALDIELVVKPSDDPAFGATLLLQNPNDESTDEVIAAPAGISILANTKADASGDWAPELALQANGNARLVASGGTIELLGADGVNIGHDYSGSTASLKTSLITTPKEFEFPDQSGTLALEGSGAPSLYDVVVAPSGGDYDTLGAAIADGCISIYVRNGTYNESALEITDPGITITGESRTNTIINVGSTFWHVTSTAVDFTLQNIGMTGSSGGRLLFDTTMNSTVQGCNFTMTNGSGETPIQFYNVMHGKFINNSVYDNSSDVNSQKASFQGGVLVSGNTFRVRPVMDGVIYVGPNCNFTSNTIVHTGGTGTGAFIAGGGICNISSNYLFGRYDPNVSASSICGGVIATSVHCNIVGNFFYECKKYGVNISFASACVVSGNSIDYSDYAVWIQGSDNIITNNFWSGATSGVSNKIGIWIDAGGRNIVAHNNMQDGNLGILVDASLSANQLLYNVVYNNTATITDNSSGYTTPTVSVGNIIA